MSNQVNKLFDTIRRRLTRAMEELPVIIGNEAVNYSLDAFNKQQWEGAAWDKRRSKKDPGRALLVKSGRLKRSIRIVRTTANSVTIGTDVPYAKVHNYGMTVNKPARKENFVRNRYTRGPKSKYFGGMGAFKKGTTAGDGLSFKAHSFQMPRRQFIGNTPQLRAHIRRISINHLNAA